MIQLNIYVFLKPLNIIFSFELVQNQIYQCKLIVNKINIQCKLLVNKDKYIVQIDSKQIKYRMQNYNQRDLQSGYYILNKTFLIVYYIFYKFLKQMMFKLCMFVCILMVGTAYYQSFNVSIQNTSQAYNAYIPYFDFCNYTGNQNINHGNVEIFNITPVSIFQAVEYADEYAFWILIKDGMAMMVNQDSLVQGYDGIVLYNSQVYANLTRHLILYQKNDSLLTFNYAIPFVNLTGSTLSVTANITQTVNLNFNNELITNFLSQCLTQDLIITALPGQSFLCSCRTLKSIFFWQQNHQSQAFFQQSLNIAYPILNVTSNPAIYDGLQQLHPFWSTMIISGKILFNFSMPNIYFCDITNKGNSSQANLVLECYDPRQNQNFVNNVIDVLWGQIGNQQQFTITAVLEKINNLQQLEFPGMIVSVYVNLRSDVFIETLDANQNSYLIIIKQGGYVYCNITFSGEIIYYGQEKVIVQVENAGEIGTFKYSYYFIELTLPIFNISSKFYPQNITFFSIECQYGITLDFEYNIFWTNILFPSSQIQQIKPLGTNSLTQIINYDLQSYFNVFGPAFEVYINNKNYDLEDIIFDSASFLVDQKILAIIDYTYIVQKNKKINNLFNTQSPQPNSGYLLYTTEKGLYKHFTNRLRINDISLNNKIESNREIVQIRIKVCNFLPPYYGHRFNNYYYFYQHSQINEETQKICRCDLLLNSCNQISRNYYEFIQFKFRGIDKTEAQISKKKLIDYLEKENNESQFLNDTKGRMLQEPPVNNSRPKKYLVGTLAQQLLVIVIYTNNSAVLSNSSNKQILQTINMNCSQWDNTNGGVYYKAFEDPVLILYCQGTQVLHQYLIRQGQMVFLRTVPLYGFTSRKQGTFFVGSQYAFMEVDLALVQNAYILKVFNKKSCCVLRLAPTAATVSVIRQIVQIKTLSYIKSIFGIDIAYYNSSGIVHNGAQYVKVYYSSTILAINQTSRNAGIQNYYYEIVFVSPIYNFAAFFREKVLFNLTMAYITYSKPPQDRQAALIFSSQSTNDNNPGLTVFEANMSFSYGSVCGPIVETSFQVNSTNQKVQVTTNQIVTPAKILGKQGQDFIQIIDVNTPGPISNWTLYNLILLVESTKIYVYAKQLDKLFMVHIQTIKTPEDDCSYTLYQFINQTSGSFISNCQAPNFHYKTPLLLLNFQNNNITHNFSFISLPMSLKDLYVIPRLESNLSYIIGLSQGPRGAITGKLFFCDIISCSTLFVSSKETYLVSYSAYTMQTNFVIISLNANQIQVWIDLSNTFEQLIPSNYSINIYPTINQQCSVLKIVSATMQGAELIISSNSYYYQVYANFTDQTIQVINKFVRYLNCDVADKFKPKTISQYNGSLKTLITLCSQKRQTLQLQEIQNYWEEETVTYTGYVQVFSFNGPQCGQNLFSPIKIVPISSSMRNDLFETYTINGYDRLIFQKISGLLIENLLNVQPYVQISIMPLTKVVQLPIVTMNIANQYYSVPVDLLIQREPFITQYIAYWFLGLYGLLNLLTLVTTIMWLCIKYSKTIKQIVPWSKLDVYSEDQTVRNSNTSGQNKSQAQRQSFLQKRSTRQVSQIQLFSHKINAPIIEK